MEHTKTFILLSRCILEKKVFSNPNWLKVFIWCLLRAGYKEKKIAGIELKRGQFIFGRKSAAAELDMPESTVYYILQQLVKINSITVNSNNKYSIITVVNYDTYQDKDFYFQQQPNNNLTTTQQQPNTNNKNKESKEGNKETYIDYFEKELWANYPNKSGKTKALKCFLKEAKNNSICDRILDVQYLYVTDHLKNNAWKQPQNGDTFYRNWRDWEELFISEGKLKGENNGKMGR